MLAAGWSAGQSLSIVCWCVSSGFGQFGPVCCGLDPDWIGFVWLPRRRVLIPACPLPPRLRETVLQDCPLARRPHRLGGAGGEMKGATIPSVAIMPSPLFLWRFKVPMSFKHSRVLPPSWLAFDTL